MTKKKITEILTTLGLLTFMLGFCVGDIVYYNHRLDRCHDMYPEGELRYECIRNTEP